MLTRGARLLGISLLCLAGAAAPSYAQVQAGPTGLPIWTNQLDPTAKPIFSFGSNGSCGCTGQTPENEPDCGTPVDTVDGGCNSTPAVYKTIALGGSVCGTAQIGTSALRDTDWYRFTIAATTNVEFVVTAQFPVQVLILNDVCPATVVSVGAGATCVQTIVQAPGLAPGSYVAFVSPQQGSPNFACGAVGSSYVATLRTIQPRGSCCIAGACTPSLTATECSGRGGTYNGDNAGCGAGNYSIVTGGSAFASIAATGTPAATAGNCDDCSEAVTLPFPFTFYGAAQTSVNIHSNGYLQFGTAFVAYVNDIIPSAAQPNNAIYPFWDDLNTLAGGDIFYATQGVAPNRKFIVEWSNVTQYALTTSETFQAVMSEGSNDIEFRYGTVTAETPAGDYTIGVENDSGTVAASITGASIGTGNTSRLLHYTPASNPCASRCGTADFDGDGDVGTDQDIEAFFRCLAGTCCATCFPGGADFNGDGDVGTDADIEAFFRVLAGRPC